MTRRIWFTVTPGSETVITKVEPAALSGARVTVRAALVDGDSDGVWVDGERSYDTYVLVNGTAVYYAQARQEAEAAFERMERAGGGHPV